MARGADSDRSLRSRHEADLLDVSRQSLAGGSRSPPLPAAVLAAAQGGRLNRLATVDQRLARTTRWYGRISDPLPPRPAADRAFADIDFGRTRAYCFATGGQIFLGEASGARRDPRYAERLADELSSTRHPATGEPAFDVRRKEELYHGAYLDKAPELVLLPHDERIHVDSSRRTWTGPFDRHDRLDPSVFYGYSGHHGLTGILAAAGPGILPGDVPEGSEITQLPATILHLLGIGAEGLDGSPIEPILEPVDASPKARGRRPRCRPSGPCTRRRRRRDSSSASATSATSSLFSHEHAHAPGVPGP